MSMAGVGLVMWATSLGCGLAIERLLRVRLGNALVLVLGLCVAFALVYPGYGLGFGDGPSIALLVAVAVAGVVFADGGIRSRLNPGWPGVAGLVTYLLFILPLIGAGHWTWAGYNLDNDTGFEMLLAQHMQSFGTHIVTQPPSTATTTTDNYLSVGYPLGTHALLATVSGTLGASVAVVYQGYLAGLAAIGAVALATVAARIVSRPVAALLGFIAMSANLTFQYAMQGELKEIGVVVTLCCAFALGREVLEAVPIRGGPEPEAGGDRRCWYRTAGGQWVSHAALRAAVLVAFPVAAMLATYNAAALPYVGAFVLFLGVEVALRTRRLPDRRWVAPLVAGAVLTALLAIPAEATIRRFYAVATAAQAVGSGPASSAQLGQLARALPLSQISGVWLSGDFRLAIAPEPAGVLTAIASAVVLLALLLALVGGVRRRQTGIVLLLGTIGLELVVVFPRISPYAQGKLLAIASPAVVLVAGLALFSLPGRLRRIGAVIGVVIAVAIVASDLLAYHNDHVAPTGRMQAMSQMADHFVGRGLVLWNESDEFAKYFGDRAQVDQPDEALTPVQYKLRYPVDFFGHAYDLDDLPLSWVEQFPNIVLRRSPAASRPPANYRLAYTNAYYVGWVRTSTPTVLRHLPVQLAQASAATLSCVDLRGLVRGAPTGSQLAVSLRPETAQFSTLQANDRSLGWGLEPGDPDTLVTTTPGHASGVVSVSGGRYTVWVLGSFPATLKVQVDGSTVGSVSGEQSADQWLPAATVQLAPGLHVLRVVRPAGRRHFAPGAGATGTLGDVAVQRDAPATLVTVPTSRWRTLCGRTVDWVELVRP